MNSIENLIKKCANEMIKKYNIVKDIKFPKLQIIEINNLGNYKIEEFEKYFNNIGENIIYFIVCNKLPFNYSEIKDKFKELKSKNKIYHISKINDKELWGKKIKQYYLYIGSKEDKAASRFKQHLGLIKPRQTYSMYLKDWWPKNNKLFIHYYEFGEKIKSDSLQIIEDLLWDYYKPLFGKKGATFNKKLPPTQKM